MTQALPPHTLEGRIVKLPPLEGKVVLHVARCGPGNQELSGAWGAVLFAGSQELLSGSGILKSEQRTLEGAVRAADAWYAQQRLIGWPPLTTISVCGSTKQIQAFTLSAPPRRSGSETTEARRARACLHSC